MQPAEAYYSIYVCVFKLLMLFIFASQLIWESTGLSLVEVLNR